MTKTQELAEAFREIIRDWLEIDELVECDAANAAETHAGVCHTHDYCDANEAMDYAFKNVFGREPVMGTADDTLWNDAWDLAKTEGFTPWKGGEMTTDSYNAACRRAADLQGLTPVLAEIALYGDHHVELLQTGGFTMVVQVRRFEPLGGGPMLVNWPVIWITDNGDGDYLLGLYTKESLDESTESVAEAYAEIDTLLKVIDELFKAPEGRRR